MQPSSFEACVFAPGLLAASLTTTVSAETLSIGLRSGTDTLDPHQPLTRSRNPPARSCNSISSAIGTIAS
jgi:hypothetical protein